MTLFLHHNFLIDIIESQRDLIDGLDFDDP